MNAYLYAILVRSKQVILWYIYVPYILVHIYVVRVTSWYQPEIPVPS